MALTLPGCRVVQPLSLSSAAVVDLGLDLSHGDLVLDGVLTICAALNAASMSAAGSCGCGSNWSDAASLSERRNWPLSVRLFPDAAGRPDEAFNASSTAMSLAPPGPQPVTPGAEKVVSLAEAPVIPMTAWSGWTVGCGSFSWNKPPPGPTAFRGESASWMFASSSPFPGEPMVGRSRRNWPE